MAEKVLLLRLHLVILTQYQQRKYFMLCEAAPGTLKFRLNHEMFETCTL